MTVPYAFGSATTSIPLSELDANFNTPITIGNTAVQLGNTVTTLNNMTLANATVSSGNVTVTSASLSGNLTFTGTGNRITGDFSNATKTSRVSFQSSTTDGATVVQLIPNGTSTSSQVAAYGGSDIDNTSVGQLTNNGTEVRVASGIFGTGTYLPMTFFTGGSEVMRIDTSGNVGIGTSSPSYRLEVKGPSATAGQLSIHDGTGDTTVSGVTAASLLFQARDSSVRTIAEIDAVNTTANGTGGAMVFQTRISDTLAERARIDSSGNLLVGTTTSQGRLTVQTTTATAGTRMVAFSDSNGRFSGFYEGADGTTFNAANTVLGVRSTTGTGRSINASGTVNASGTDYAEYMTKAGDFVVAKGDVVGINQQGLITNVFAESVSFVVKSTSPSYVGGDTWGGGFEDDLEALEAARQKVDRIAFAGQVPVNVLGAMPGQYIVPVEDNDGIRGVAKNEADLTLAEYMRAVGKVIAIETDGRAKIIVKVA